MVISLRNLFNCSSVAASCAIPGFYVPPRIGGRAYVDGGLWSVSNLDILARDVEDEAHNTTRFVILAAEPEDADHGAGDFITTFIFRVRNVPAALYKSLGGFATNGVNMTKLESYQPEGMFAATMFFADIEGHPSERRVQLALEELGFFSTEIHVLGTYPASAARSDLAKRLSP